LYTILIMILFFLSRRVVFLHSVRNTIWTSSPHPPSPSPLSMLVYTVKKVYWYSRPQPGCHSPNSPWPGIIYPVPVPGRFGQNKSRNLVILLTVCRLPLLKVIIKKTRIFLVVVIIGSTFSNQRFTAKIIQFCKDLWENAKSLK